MKGIILLSHGNMASGLLHTSTIFFGENQEAIEALQFQMIDDCDAFEKEIGEAIKRVDQGEGVIILTDLFAGTPAHKTTKYLNPGYVDVICGMNLPLLMELLGARMSDNVDIDEIIETARTGLCRWQIQRNNQLEEDFY